jgi:hypothetical protein
LARGYKDEIWGRVVACANCRVWIDIAEPVRGQHARYAGIESLACSTPARRGDLVQVHVDGRDLDGGLVGRIEMLWFIDEATP